jgi:serine/threonine protein kinase
MIRRTLDHYRIESSLGQGGMGVVYLATDLHRSQPVAIKLLPPDRVADAGGNQCFAVEVKAASALNHSNIVTIYRIRSADEIEFIAMEHIEGKTLDEMVPAKGLRPAPAPKWAIHIADALAKAHKARIIHRDLNVSYMVAGEGHIEVLDSGLAKLLDPLQDYNPVRSPDGRWIAFLRGQLMRLRSSELWLIRPIAGDQCKLADVVRRTIWGAGELDVLSFGKDLSAGGEPRRSTRSERAADFPAWMRSARSWQGHLRLNHIARRQDHPLHSRGLLYRRSDACGELPVNCGRRVM